ncbi:MAG: prepilin-type N-terminal cleavage/methylation domain-containing protein [Planctomycetota bacterium]
MRLTRQRKNGFTLIELMVVIAIIAALAALLLPVIADMIDNARARACTANLKSIGLGFFAYRDKNQSKLPSLVWGGDPGVTLPVAAYGTPDEVLNAALRTSLGTNAMQNVWLLIDGSYVSGGDKAFKCPGDTKWTGRPATLLKFGWTSMTQFSYGIQHPYGGTSATPPATPDATMNWASPNGVIAGDPASGEQDFKGTPMYPESAIYMADRNPRKAWADVITGPSNHPAGIGYLEKGSTNNFAKTVDGKIGINSDDIYVSRAAGTGLPSLASAGLVGGAVGGQSKVPCTDTVIWPLDARP